MPLIKDHAFIEWLVTPPSAEDMRRSPYNIRVGEMQKLEAMWKENPDATLDGACVCVCFYYIYIFQCYHMTVYFTIAIVLIFDRFYFHSTLIYD